MGSTDPISEALEAATNPFVVSDRESLAEREARLDRDGGYKPQAGGDASAVGVQNTFKPYKTRVLPRGASGPGLGLRHDPKDNRPIIESRRQEREIAKMTGLEWD